MPTPDWRRAYKRHLWSKVPHGTAGGGLQKKRRGLTLEYAEPSRHGHVGPSARRQVSELRPAPGSRRSYRGHYARICTNEVTGLLLHRLLDEELVVAIPSGHPLALCKRSRDAAPPLKALAGEPFIILGLRSGELQARSVRGDARQDPRQAAGASRAVQGDRALRQDVRLRSRRIGPSHVTTQTTFGRGARCSSCQTQRNGSRQPRSPNDR